MSDACSQTQELTPPRSLDTILAVVACTITKLTDVGGSRPVAFASPEEMYDFEFQATTARKSAEALRACCAFLAAPPGRSASEEDNMARASILLARSRCAKRIPESVDDWSEGLTRVVPVSLLSPTERAVLKRGFDMAKEVLLDDRMITTLAWANALSEDSIREAVRSLTHDNVRIVDDAGREADAWLGDGCIYIRRPIVSEPSQAADEEMEIEWLERHRGVSPVAAPGDEWSVERQLTKDVSEYSVSVGAAVLAAARIQVHELARLVVCTASGGLDHYTPDATRAADAAPSWWEAIHRIRGYGERFDSGCIAERCWLGVRLNCALGAGVGSLPQGARRSFTRAPLVSLQDADLPTKGNLKESTGAELTGWSERFE